MVGKGAVEEAAYHSVRSDPAIEAWSEMHSTMYQRFRFTPKRTRQFAVWGLGIPLLTYYAASYANNRWDLRAMTREDSLVRGAQAVRSEGEKDD